MSNRFMFLVAICSSISVSAQTSHDVTPPEFPGGLPAQQSRVGRSQCAIQWPAATDDFGVTHYVVYVNDNEYAAVPGTSITVDWPCEFLNATVYARDAAGNESAELLVPRLARRSPTPAPSTPAPPLTAEMETLMAAAISGPDAIAEIAAQPRQFMPVRRAPLVVSTVIRGDTTTRTRLALAATQSAIRACNTTDADALGVEELDLDVLMNRNALVVVRGGSLAARPAGVCMVHVLESMSWTPPPAYLTLHYEVEHNARSPH